MGRKKARKTDLYVRLQWKQFNTTKSFRRICSPVCLPAEDAIQLPITHKGKTYEEFSGYDIAEREGLQKLLRFAKEAYDEDRFQPRELSRSERPPVKRVHAIYGVNLDTEVGCVYSRQDTCTTSKMLQSFYVPDKKAVIDRTCGYKVSGGLIQETPQTKQECADDLEISGDGTVPYWSLSHAKTWDGTDCRVTVQEIEKAEHRKILNDSRFHEALYEYVSQ